MIGRAGSMACVLALGATGGALLGGCGGGTQTVSVSNAPPPASAGTPSTTGRSASARATPTTETNAGTATQGASGQGTNTTRTAPGPAFVHTGTQSTEPAAGAAAGEAANVVSTHGYTPVDTSTYHPNQTLRVLIGTRAGSTAGYNQRAFFFVDNRYIGTDSSQPSASVRVVGQSDTEVTLAYSLYRSQDSLCCPSGGVATVHFRLDNGRLVPLEQIPPVSSATGLARQ